MISLLRTDAFHHDFLFLVRLLDRELSADVGKLPSFHQRYNRFDQVDHIVLAYVGGQVVGAGGFKLFDQRSVEFRQMFILPNFRGQGIGSKISQKLNQWLAQLHKEACGPYTSIHRLRKLPVEMAFKDKSGVNFRPIQGR